MAIYPGYQVFPRLHLGYLHRHNNVNVRQLGKQDFQLLPREEWLRRHPVRRRQVALRGLYPFLFPSS